ncbi:SNF2-related protein [Arenibaculum pallidiluteum]|uniref:SNF2-related protein n=1 Tax=Arenibaculum pallidiluteum TaxID=2812559 RepID=UPI001A9771C8|nr:SNF2-related protein [Arenibaculum pallidiluteum]
MTDLFGAGAPALVPHPHQIEARDRILSARAAGRWGFLLGDRTGLGKTLSTWLAVAAMPEPDVLIVCPRGAIPQWRQTIARAGMAAKDVTITNYERTKALLRPAAPTQRRSTRARNNELARTGMPVRAYSIVVFDEAHRLRNPYAQQTMACRAQADAARFRIFLSATAGQAPHELGYLGPLLGEAAGQPTGDLAEFRGLMKRLGIGRAKGRWTNWRWEPNEADRRTMADLLYAGPHAIGLRRRPEDIAGWPEVQRALVPTALDRGERRLYEATWREFRRELGLAGGSTRRPAGWAADLRFRQKGSLLRVRGTADLAEELLENGHQVSVSVAFLETGAMLADALGARGWRTGRITGEFAAPENEATRVAFQTGALDAVVFTATESISLHQGEMPGGDRPRALVIHDIRYSAIQMQQVEGRCHRDGRAAAVWYAYAEDTVEEKVAAAVIARMIAMDGMAGDDTALLEEISAILSQAAEGAVGGEAPVHDPAVDDPAVDDPAVDAGAVFGT